MMPAISSVSNHDSEYKKIARDFFYSNWFGYLTAFIVALINIHFFYSGADSSIFEQIIDLTVSKLFGSDSEIFRLQLFSILLSAAVVLTCSFIVQFHVNSILNKYVNDDLKNNFVNNILKIIKSGYNTSNQYPLGKLDFIRKKLALIYSATMVCAVFVILSPIYIYKLNTIDLTICSLIILLFGYFIRKFTVIYIEEYVVLSLICFSNKNELYKILENKKIFFKDI